MGQREALALAFVTALTTMGCGQSIAGRACDASTPCPSGYSCVTAHDGSTRCMMDCELNETVCRDGKACLPLSVSGGACYLGGNVAIGGDCTSDLDCTRTAICIRSAATGQAICLEGCNLDGTHDCPNMQPCLPTSGGVIGYCGAH
jgi:hypothetical protein